MAARRKNFIRTRGKHFQLPKSEQFEKACFLDDLLNGAVVATDVQEVRDGQNRLVLLTYNDPNG